MKQFQIYESYGNWRWQLKGRNGRIIASSSQGFSTKDGARINANLTYEELGDAMLRKELT